MKKIILVLALISLVGCGDSPEEAQKKREQQILQQQQQILAQQQQEIEQQNAYIQQQGQQQQYAQQQYSQQPVVQGQAPVIVQQPAVAQQPVVVQQPSGHSAVTDMLVGALAGNAVSNMINQPKSLSDHNFYSSSRTQVSPYSVRKNVTINNYTQPKTISPQIKKNYMDMNKLSTKTRK